jgi:hypothetical protein
MPLLLLLLLLLLAVLLLLRLQLKVSLLLLQSNPVVPVSLHLASPRPSADH